MDSFWKNIEGNYMEVDLGLRSGFWGQREKVKLFLSDPASA